MAPAPTPQQQTCLVQPPDGQGPPILSESHPTPALQEPYDVLVRVVSVALNPTDYKMPKFDPVPGAIMGCDFAGTVVTVGPNAAELPIGARVCGCVHGSNPGKPDGGAFAEYLVTDARLLLRVPDAWSDLEGAALGGIGWTTVGLAMEDSLQLKGVPSNPAPPLPDRSRIPVLVYGGATATGTMACQILSHAGYAPIATASKSSSALVKKFGATATIPYTSPSAGEEIKASTKGSLKHALDCIVSPESVSCCFTALSRIGGRYAGLEYCDEKWRTRQRVQVSMPLAYETFGREVKLKGVYAREADPSKFDLAVRWRVEVQQLLDNGSIQCHPVREVAGKWNGISRGLAMLEAGEVHGQKLVVRLSKS